MQVFQRAKASMPFLRNAQGSKLLLVLACLLLCSAVVPLFTGAGTAHATNVVGNAPVKPATSGGGCNSSGYVSACISENSEGFIVPDGYVLHSNTYVTAIVLLRDGFNWTIDDLGRSYPAGTHLYGFSAEATAGHWWTTEIIWKGNDGFDPTFSPPLYT
ncbi:MAG: hypothetical protein JO011_11665 [Ktedonobacteraceae bacterium]|nr:hypothetical protein [Ktedonobacteraceae bacterium]